MVGKRKDIRYMKILYFDLSAIFILVIMIAILLLRNMQENRTNKLLMVLYINVLITTIFDLWSEAYNIWFLAKDSNSAFRYFLYYGYFYHKTGLYFFFSTNYHFFVHICENQQNPTFYSFFYLCLCLL